MIRPAIFAGLMLAAPVAAQERAPQVNPPDLDGLFARTGEVVDTVSVWSADIDGDGTDDRFAQVAYGSAEGGNAYWFRHFILPAPGHAGDPIEVLIDAAGVESVRQGPGGPVAVTLSYAQDDARCCPSIRRFQSLRLSDLTPASP